MRLSSACGFSLWTLAWALALGAGALRAAAGEGVPPAVNGTEARPDEGQILNEWPVAGPTPPDTVMLYYRAELGAQATLTSVVDTVFPEGTGAYRVEITAGPGTQAADAQVSFTAKALLGRSGRYRGAFWVRASRPVSFVAAARLHEAPWTLLAEGSQVTVEADTTWRAIAIPFAPTQDLTTETEIRCPGLLLGELPAGTTLWIAGVSLDELQAPAALLPLVASGELLQNPGFEEGMAGWEAQAADVTSADGLGRNGSKACLVRQRQARWGSPAQDIRPGLAANGPGAYDLSAAVRKVRGRGEAFVVIHLKDANGERWVVTPKRTAGERGFTRLGATCLLAWTGALQAAEISVQTVGDDTADMLVDDVSLRALVNLAKGRPHDASSAAPEHPADLAIDGDLATGWQSAGAGEAWLAVDFGETRGFNACLVGVGSRHRGEYAIEVWEGEWRTAFAGNDIHAPLDELRFAPVAARRVRLRFSASPSAPTLTELGFYTYDGGVVETTERRTVPPPPADPARRGARTLVGAIRWDGWCGDRDSVGLGLERAMTPEKYHHRLPFYATVRTPGPIEARCVTQEVMDREIAFAQEAGVDYWAFDWYSAGTGLALARELYLASARRNEVKWCTILGTHSFAADEQTWLVEQFKAPNYQCVLGGRPLLYVFQASPKHVGLVRGLREAAERAAIPAPFIVFMGWSAAVAEVADACGADAVGAYVNPLGDRNTFAANMTHERNQWQALRGTGQQMVPTVTTGWDPRPFLDCPVPWYRGATESHWVEPATPEQVAAQLQEALAYVKAHPEATLANTVLIYAWNENAEGGWIVPTLGELRDAHCPLRLDAVRAVLKPGTPRGSGWEALCR